VASITRRHAPVGAAEHDLLRFERLIASAE
jgi:hypothetical protein